VTTEQSLDVTDQLDAIERSVTIGPGDAGIGPWVVQRVSRIYRTDVDDLWDAVTNAERLPRFFAPVEGDFQLGGRYQVQGNAGGTIEQCDPPHLFEVTWEFGEGKSWVLVTIEAVDADSAKLTLEHRGEVPDEFWTQFGPGATGVGWDLSFYGLARYLENGEELGLLGEAWFSTDEAKACIVGSSARWAEVTIAAGVPEAQARAAETATSAFFQGEG
jgi:uncharacterized protein YndB with AHSA1/START domain